MLGERLAGARRIPAALQLRVEQIKQRSADLTELEVAESWA
jgi:hypothetical protein